MVGPTNWWEVGDWLYQEVGLVGGGLSKLVGGGRLAPQSGGRWEAETPATHPLYNSR